MNLKIILANLLALWMLMHATIASALPKLELQGYVDDSGAITILNGGDTTDPYFALQALLLAHDNGMDISAPAVMFANWLVTHQKPDGTFDRFCKSAAKKWVSCKTADADDSLLALWMRLLETMPDKMSKNPGWANSYAFSKKALDHLYQPSRGVYMVSPVYLHGLFMDNLEVWSLKAHVKKPKPGELDKLAQDIYKTFWQPANKKFLVSTQLEQQTQKTFVLPGPCGTSISATCGFSKSSPKSKTLLRKLDAFASRRVAETGRDRLSLGLACCSCLAAGRSVKCPLLAA